MSKPSEPFSVPPISEVDYIPLDQPAVRATNFEVRFDGGAFQLFITEIRDSGETRSGPMVRKWKIVELGRFHLSPIALRRLAASIENGLATYKEAVGQLPDEAVIGPVLHRLAQQRGPKTS